MGLSQWDESGSQHNIHCLVQLRIDYGESRGGWKPVCIGYFQSISSSNTDFVNRYIRLNTDYDTNTPQDGGIVVNYSPTATQTNLSGSFVGGIVGVSNPTVDTVDSNLFSAGDLVLIRNSTSNNGLYEVQSHIGTVLQVRGVGLNAITYNIAGNQFVAEASAGRITRVAVSILRANSSTGVFQQARGSNASAMTSSRATPRHYNWLIATAQILRLS